jgi:hypothetical protein
MRDTAVSGTMLPLPQPATAHLLLARSICLLTLKQKLRLFLSENVPHLHYKYRPDNARRRTGPTEL